MEVLFNDPLFLGPLAALLTAALLGGVLRLSARRFAAVPAGWAAAWPVAPALLAGLGAAAAAGADGVSWPPRPGPDSWPWGVAAAWMCGAALDAVRAPRLPSLVVAGAFAIAGAWWTMGAPTVAPEAPLSWVYAAVVLVMWVACLPRLADPAQEPGTVLVALAALAVGIAVTAWAAAAEHWLVPALALLAALAGAAPWALRAGGVAPRAAGFAGAAAVAGIAADLGAAMPGLLAALAMLAVLVPHAASALPERPGAQGWRGRPSARLAMLGGLSALPVLLAALAALAGRHIHGG